MQVIVYGQNSPRLNYLVEVVCADYFGLKWTLLEDVEQFKAASGIKVNYSDQELEGVFRIKPSGFMNETSIRKFCPTYVKVEDNHLLFPSSEDLGFDLFSAAFYLLSRYEEYVIDDRDHHNRFTAKQSLAFHNGFLEEPIVDQWFELLKSTLEKFYETEFPASNKQFQVIPSFDLDNAYAFVGKGFKRNLGGFVRDLLKGRITWVKRRIAAWRDDKKDPYNTYDYILEKVKNYQAVFFLPLGRKGPFDKNVRWNDNKFKDLVKRISENHEIGLHPSYNSNYLHTILSLEVKRFQKLSKTPALRSRQHYLKLVLPGTYLNLIENGIKHDYTMGYADLPGFRAGIARSYRWYNLDAEQTSELMIHPFMYMDGTFNDYMKISTEEAIEQMQALKDHSQSFNGDFVFIWHNDSLRDSDNWKGWRSLFEASL